MIWLKYLMAVFGIFPEDLFRKHSLKRWLDRWAQVRSQKPTRSQILLRNTLGQLGSRPNFLLLCRFSVPLWSKPETTQRESPFLDWGERQWKDQSLLSVLAIFKPQAIAKVMKQKCLNKSVISPDTQEFFSRWSKWNNYGHGRLEDFDTGRLYRPWLQGQSFYQQVVPCW